MDLPWLDVVSRIVHVGTAIVLIGGSVFSLLVITPSVATLDENTRRAVSEALMARWKRFVHIGVVLFLASGLYNYMQAIPNHKGDGLYHALLGTKMLLALFVFFVSAALVGRSQKLEGMRRNRVQWLRALVIVAAVIVCMSGFLKIRGIPATPVEAETRSSVE